MLAEGDGLPISPCNLQAASENSCSPSTAHGHDHRLQLHPANTCLLLFSVLQSTQPVDCCGVCIEQKKYSGFFLPLLRNSLRWELARVVCFVSGQG
jgi:hypothetical protein